MTRLVEFKNEYKIWLAAYTSHNERSCNLEAIYAALILLHIHDPDLNNGSSRVAVRDH